MKGLRERDRKTLPVLSTHKKKNQKKDNFDVSKLHIAVLSAFSVYTTISKSALYGIQINTEQQKYHQFTIQPWSSRTSNLQLY